MINSTTSATLVFGQIVAFTIFLPSSRPRPTSTQVLNNELTWFNRTVGEINRLFLKKFKNAITQQEKFFI